MNILYGSVTGTAEKLARDAAKVARARGHKVNMSELDEIAMDDLEDMDDVLVFIATYGEGEMPFNAETFWDEMEFNVPTLDGLTYGVLALGDTAYEKFCQAGKDIDEMFEDLGATRRIARVDCDLNYEKDAEAWIDKAIPKKEGAEAVEVEPEEEGPRRWSRADPYQSNVIGNERLSGPASTKQINHISLDITDSGIEYAAGDAIGVISKNSPALVSAMLERLDAKAGDVVEGYDLPLGELLTSKFEIMTPPDMLIRAVSSVIEDEELKAVVESGERAKMEVYRWNKDVIDILNVDPRLKVGADILLGLLQPLQHRAYSIASSPVTAPNQIDLTVAAVRWEHEDRSYEGVCSTQLTDRTAVGEVAGMFMIPNKHFRLPEDPKRGMVMVGPGTGIAPFLGFLDERRDTRATGENWLYFGDRTEGADYIYRERLEGYVADKTLTHLRTAFSRDGDKKVYVQDRMKEDQEGLFQAFENGAAFYLCGDAKGMAPDVEEALLEIIAVGLNSSRDDAIRYVSTMRREGRYLKDVY